MTEQFVEIAGQQMVILTGEDFARLSEEAESYRDICSAVEARTQREAGEEYVPAELVSRILEGENPLKVWRKYRGLTLEALGAMVGRQGSMISKLEKGHLDGSIKLWQSLAAALKVDLEEIVPTA